MKIAVATPWEESVPPKGYGGTELVAYNVIENLVKQGHDITLLATGDSETSAKLIEIFPKSLRTQKRFDDLKLRDAYKFMGVGKVVNYLNQNDFDIVHNHIGWRLLPFDKAINHPMVTTLHGPLDVPYQQEVYGQYSDSNYISISLDQREPMPELNFVANVYNGIRMDDFKFHPEPEDHFVFLGRMSPEKGPVQAIEIAKKAGVKLLMAAKVDVVDKEFFEKEVEPKIDGDQIKFIGEMNRLEKIEYLGKGKALIAPIQWEEPFGLFFVEAMATGTPVISNKRGSVPELVVDGKTGYVCETVDEAAARIKEIDKIDRRACYDHAHANFSAKKMTEEYLETYQKAINMEK